jgi:predicted enzyme related to lactoylglutathione lyase
MKAQYEEITDIVHVEWPSTNLERTVAFYEALFGWSFDVKEGVAFCRNTVNHIGAFVLVVDLPAASSWPKVFVAVTTIDEAFRHVTANGGSVVEPRQRLPNIGWQAKVKDPDGNVVGLIEYEGGR